MEMLFSNQNYMLAIFLESMESLSKLHVCNYVFYAVPFFFLFQKSCSPYSLSPRVMSPTIVSQNIYSPHQVTLQRQWQPAAMYQSNQADPVAYGSYTTQPTGVSCNSSIDPSLIHTYSQCPVFSQSLKHLFCQCLYLPTNLKNIPCHFIQDYVNSKLTQLLFG